MELMQEKTYFIMFFYMYVYFQEVPKPPLAFLPPAWLLYITQLTGSCPTGNPKPLTSATNSL